MNVTLEESVTTTTRTIHLTDGPTVDSDKSAGKKRSFQVKKVTCTQSLGSTTTMLWGTARLGGVDVTIKKTYNGKKGLPTWVSSLLGFNG